MLLILPPLLFYSILFQCDLILDPPQGPTSLFDPPALFLPVCNSPSLNSVSSDVRGGVWASCLPLATNFCSSEIIQVNHDVKHLPFIFFITGVNNAYVELIT